MKKSSLMVFSTLLFILPLAFADPIPAPYSLFPILYVVGLFFIGLATEAFVIKKLKPRFFENPKHFDVFFAINLLTYIFIALLAFHSPWISLLGEVITILAEWLVLKRYGLGAREVVLANLASLLVGVAITIFIVVPYGGNSLTLYYALFNTIALLAALYLFWKVIRSFNRPSIWLLVLLLVFFLFILAVDVVTTNFSSNPWRDPQFIAKTLLLGPINYGGSGSSIPIDFVRGMAIDGAALAREVYLDENCIMVRSELPGFFCKNNTCEYRGETTIRVVIRVICDKNIAKELPGCKDNIGCIVEIKKPEVTSPS